MKRLLLILLTSVSIASAQDQWTITNYEWHDKKTFEKYISPDQWIGKEIIIADNSISFDFKGIQEFEADIDYYKCELFEPIKKTVVSTTDKDMFAFQIEKFIECKNQYLLLETKPNCYKYPFKDFMICDKKGLFELRGVYFIVTKE